MCVCAEYNCVSMLCFCVCMYVASVVNVCIVARACVCVVNTVNVPLCIVVCVCLCLSVILFHEWIRILGFLCWSLCAGAESVKSL